MSWLVQRGRLVRSPGVRRGVALALLVALAPLVPSARAQPATSALPAPPVPPAVPAESSLRLVDVLDAVRAHPLAAAARAGVDRAVGQQLAAEGAFDVRARVRGTTTPTAYYDSTTLDAEVRMLTPVWGITPFAGWRLGRGEFPAYDGKLSTLQRGELRAGLDVPLLRDGPIDRPRADLQKAELADDQARAELRQRELELQQSAAFAYWDWVAAGTRLTVRERQLQLARDRDEGIRRTITQGNTAPIEALDNARVIATRQAIVVTGQRDVIRSGLELSMFLRGPGGAATVPGPERLPVLVELPPPLAIEVDLAAVIAQAYAAVPSVAAVGVRLEANAVDVELARNQLLPGVTASAYVTRGFGPSETALPDRSETAIGVGLTIDMPVQLRQARGALAIARADRTRLEQERRFLLDRIAIEVRAAHAELVAARQRAQLAGTQAQLAEQLAEAERTRFARGDTTILFVNLREEGAADAAASKIDATADYFKARARYVVAAGLSPRDSM